MTSSAIISTCGKYRYTLTRDWIMDGQEAKSAVFIGLNPSTADASKDDPTIRRCIKFAQGWGCTRLVMVNLFAYRATEPAIMKRQVDPVGTDNNLHLIQQTRRAHIVIAAWGVHGTHASRDRAVAKLMRDKEITLHCLGFTREWHPRHPLYLPGSAMPIPYASH